MSQPRNKLVVICGKQTYHVHELVDGDAFELPSRVAARWLADSPPRCREISETEEELFRRKAQTNFSATPRPAQAPTPKKPKASDAD